MQQGGGSEEYNDSERLDDNGNDDIFCEDKEATNNIENIHR